MFEKNDETSLPVPDRETWPCTGILDIARLSVGLSLVAVASRLPTGFGTDTDNLGADDFTASLIPAEMVAVFFSTLLVAVPAVVIVSATFTSSRYGRPLLLAVAAVVGTCSFWAVEPVRLFGHSIGVSTVARGSLYWLANDRIILPYLNSNSHYRLLCLLLAVVVLVAGLAACWASINRVRGRSFGYLMVKNAAGAVVAACAVLPIVAVAVTLVAGPDSMVARAIQPESDPLVAIVGGLGIPVPDPLMGGPLAVRWTTQVFWIPMIVLLLVFGIVAMIRKGESLGGNFLKLAVVLVLFTGTGLVMQDTAIKRIDYAVNAQIVHPGSASPGTWLEFTTNEAGQLLAWQLYETVPRDRSDTIYLWATTPINGVLPYRGAVPQPLTQSPPEASPVLLWEIKEAKSRAKEVNIYAGNPGNLVKVW